MSRRFSNPWLAEDDHSILEILKWKLGKNPPEPPSPAEGSDDPAPWIALKAADIATPPVAGWKATWLGHASFLVQGCGLNLLIDPIFSDYCAPFRIKSLKRLVPPPCALGDLPRVDAVLLTHGHYDHLDLPTLATLGKGMRLIVPEGHASWLARRGFHEVTEVPWNESANLTDRVRVTATPAQHFTARTPWDRNRGHWCGWLLQGGDRTLWHAGDSGWCPAFHEIGKSHGPIDLGMIPIGAYSPRSIMSTVHVTPEEAVTIFEETCCKRAVAMHWGTFRLTDEPMSEPPARLRLACETQGIHDFVALPVGGQVMVD